MLVRRDEPSEEEFHPQLRTTCRHLCVKKDSMQKLPSIHLAGNIFCPWTNQRTEILEYKMALMLQALRVCLKEAAKSACKEGSQVCKKQPMWCGGHSVETITRTPPTPTELKACMEP